VDSLTWLQQSRALDRGLLQECVTLVTDFGQRRVSNTCGAFSNSPKPLQIPFVRFK
jgi:hypothetical protein